MTWEYIQHELTNLTSIPTNKLKEVVGMPAVLKYHDNDTYYFGKILRVETLPHLFEYGHEVLYSIVYFAGDDNIIEKIYNHRQSHASNAQLYLHDSYFYHNNIIFPYIEQCSPARILNDMCEIKYKNLQFNSAVQGVIINNYSQYMVDRKKIELQDMSVIDKVKLIVSSSDNRTLCNENKIMVYGTHFKTIGFMMGRITNIKKFSNNKQPNSNKFSYTVTILWENKIITESFFITDELYGLYGSNPIYGDNQNRKYVTHWHL